MVWSLGTPWSWRETTIWPSSMTRLTPSSLHQFYAQRSSRAVQPINQRSCYSQLQAMLPLHQPWLFPHQLKLPRNTCGHLPWTPRQSFRSSWRKPMLGWTSREHQVLYAILRWTSWHLHCSNALGAEQAEWDFPRGFPADSGFCAE